MRTVVNLGSMTKEIKNKGVESGILRTSAVSGRCTFRWHSTHSWFMFYVLLYTTRGPALSPSGHYSEDRSQCHSLNVVDAL